VSNFIKRALQKVVGNMERTKMGLYLPPDYIAGRHFKGFSGYDPWIQDCIRPACQMVRGVPPDELSELSAWVVWQPINLVPNENGIAVPTGGVTLDCIFIEKHAVVLRKIDEFTARIEDALKDKNPGRSFDVNFTEKAREQIRRVDNSRAQGTLMVIAMNLSEFEHTGEIKMGVSAWNPADIEEAKSLPKQEYILE
jgi:hypothetical protein